MSSTRRPLKFSEADRHRLMERMRDRRRGSKFVPVGRDDMSNLLVDIARLGGVGDALTDEEVVEAYRVIDTDRGNSRNVRDTLLERLLYRWRTVAASA